MRKSTAMELNENILGGTKTTNNSRKCLLYGVIIISNVASFMLGFFVSNKLFQEDKNLICSDGSL